MKSGLLSQEGSPLGRTTHVTSQNRNERPLRYPHIFFSSLSKTSADKNLDVCVQSPQRRKMAGNKPGSRFSLFLVLH
jgi:hypothetical protein